MARRNPAAPSRKNAARRLENIKDQMEVLNEEALAIVDEAGDMLEYGRAYMYWYGNISNALEGDQVSMEQTIASLREPREEVVRENPRKKGSDALRHALQQSRVPWSQMSREEIEAVAQDAAVHGDTVLARRALAALARRRINPHRGEAHALLADLEAAARTFRPRAHDIRAEAHPDMLEVSFMPEDAPPGGTRGMLTPTAKKWSKTTSAILRKHRHAVLEGLSGKVGQSHDGRIYVRVFLSPA